MGRSSGSSNMQLSCLAFLVLVGHQVLSKELCPDGYVEIGTQCFLMVKETNNWDQANNYCKQNSAQLATVKDPKALRDYVIKYYPTRSFWVGGSHNKKTDNWQWTSGATIDQSFPWGINDQGVQQHKGKKHRCMILRYFPIQDEQEYVDNKCGMKNHFICERQKVPDECPKAGGLRIGDLCVTIIDTKLRWDDAEKACANDGNQLVTLKSKSDQSALHEYMLKKYPGIEFWLGGSDKAKNGNWIWVSGEKMDGFPQPSGNQPSGGQACLAWGYKNAYDDGSCNILQPYICELDI